MNKTKLLQRNLMLTFKCEPACPISRVQPFPPSSSTWHSICMHVTERLQQTWDEDVDEVAHGEQCSCGVKEVHIQEGYKRHPEVSCSKPTEVEDCSCVVNLRLGHHVFEVRHPVSSTCSCQLLLYYSITYICVCLIYHRHQNWSWGRITPGARDSRKATSSRLLLNTHCCQHQQLCVGPKDPDPGC